MILNRVQLLFAIAVVMIAIVLVSCVEIPDKAPDPPVLNAEFRFISVMPTGGDTIANIKIAEGPNFTTYSTFPSGSSASPTSYYTFLSGSKRIAYGGPDTVRVTFETDQRATLAFCQTRTGTYQALKLPYRYTFSPNGIVDTALVRFINLVQNAKDTIDVYRTANSFANGVVSANNILYGATSAAVKIPTGQSYTFFFTGPSDTTRMLKDSIVINGGSRKIYTVFVYDKYDTLLVNKNANVKVKVLEEL